MDKFQIAFNLLQNLITKIELDKINADLMVNTAFTIAEKFINKVNSDPEFIAAQKKAQAQGMQPQPVKPAETEKAPSEAPKKS